MWILIQGACIGISHARSKIGSSGFSKATLAGSVTSRSQATKAANATQLMRVHPLITSTSNGFKDIWAPEPWINGSQANGEKQMKWNMKHWTKAATFFTANACCQRSVKERSPLWMITSSQFRSHLPCDQLLPLGWLFSLVSELGLSQPLSCLNLLVKSVRLLQLAQSAAYCRFSWAAAPPLPPFLHPLVLWLPCEGQVVLLERLVLLVLMVALNQRPSIGHLCWHRPSANHQSADSAQIHLGGSQSVSHDGSGQQQGHSKMPNTIQHDEACRQSTFQRVGSDIDWRASALPPSVQPILVAFSVPFGTGLEHESEEVPLIPGLAIHMSTAVTSTASRPRGGHGNSEKGSAWEALWRSWRKI